MALALVHGGSGTWSWPLKVAYRRRYGSRGSKVRWVNPPPWVTMWTVAESCRWYRPTSLQGRPSVGVYTGTGAGATGTREREQGCPPRCTGDGPGTGIGRTGRTGAPPWRIRSESGRQDGPARGPGAARGCRGPRRRSGACSRQPSPGWRVPLQDPPRCRQGRPGRRLGRWYAHSTATVSAATVSSCSRRTAQSQSAPPQSAVAAGVQPSHGRGTAIAPPQHRHRRGHSHSPATVGAVSVTPT